jgi:predicted regulator of Ras-like GTPase activity (Roadblock/LC7/MglB family)
VADYLKKPFSIDEVLSVVEREIAKGKSRQVAPSAKPAEKPPRLYIFQQRDLEQIETLLSRLRAQASAESAMLVEQAGYVIAAKGLSTAGDIEPLSDLIATSRSTSASLASLLGETQDFSTSYMEGQRVSVYTTSLGRGLYLIVIVPKGTKQGLVWLYAKEAAVEIDRCVQRATDSMQKQLGHAVGAADAEVLRKEMAAQQVENVFDRRRGSAAPPPPRLERTPPPSSVSTISFKKDRPQPEVKSAPRVEESPVEPGPPVPGITFEEAMSLGLLANIAPEPPAAEAASGEEAATGTLTPEKFEEALLKGLFGD